MLNFKHISESNMLNAFKPFLMETYSFLFITIIISSSMQHNHASPEYSRPPPRPLVAASNNRPDSYPTQVHISLVGKDRMRVTWVTSQKHATKSLVEYGKSCGKYDASATGDHTSYRYFFYTSGAIHNVVIGPLDPATTYFYRCGGSGPEFSFRTPPSGFPIDFVIVGDLGQTGWTESTLRHVDAQDYDVLLLPGDLSYADTQQPLWDSFGRLVEPYASRRPWMVTEGNHEIENFIPVVFPHSFTAYNHRWLMPYEPSGSTSNLYYSFDVAGAHILMLGSYAEFQAESEQYRWLEADLARVDRKKTPWLFALVHAPWYNSNQAHRGEGESMRAAMEELLYKARVDVVFAGHVHSYERFTRVFDNKADPCGAVHVTIGDGGNREGLALNFDKEKPELSVYREASFGHGRLRVYNETHAHWSWHRNNDTNSFAADEIWLHSLFSSKSCSECAAANGSQTHRDEL